MLQFQCNNNQSYFGRVTMFYYYLRFFNWFSTIFGLHFPVLSKSGKVFRRWFSVWSFIVSMLYVGSCFYPKNFWSDIKVNTHLDQISNANNLIVNVIIIILNVCNGGKIHRQTYATVNSILYNLPIHRRNVILLAIKLQMWMTFPAVVFTTAIIMELIYANPPYTLIVKMPIFISMTHLILHLSLMLAVLKVINLHISEKSPACNNFFLEKSPKENSLLHYYFSPTITMFEVDSNTRKGYSLYLLSKIYDEVGICMTLLEKGHGIQMVLSFWLMFSNAVTGITLITKERANMAWVVVVRSALPFFWSFIGCYVDNQLRDEVNRTELLLVKYSIDFRCDPTTREALQTFKEVVAANRLEFSACNLFRLNYATILGTVVNVITYSIILIQIL